MFLMIEFTSLLWIWQGQAAGRWHFVTVPEDQSVEIKAAQSGIGGVIPVGGPLGGGEAGVDASHNNRLPRQAFHYIG